ncbi:MAG: hypothetical protein WCD76_10290 [Pyrinomonadaceae bacterium]
MMNIHLLARAHGMGELDNFIPGVDDIGTPTTGGGSSSGNGFNWGSLIGPISSRGFIY